jgi:predicted nuclease with TOPRIM domain
MPLKGDRLAKEKGRVHTVCYVKVTPPAEAEMEERRSKTSGTADDPLEANIAEANEEVEREREDKNSLAPVTEKKTEELVARIEELETKNDTLEQKINKLETEKCFLRKEVARTGALEAKVEELETGLERLKEQIATKLGKVGSSGKELLSSTMIDERATTMDEEDEDFHENDETATLAAKKSSPIKEPVKETMD